MEPKLIKEENGEKEGAQGYGETPRTRAKGEDKTGVGWLSTISRL